MLVQRPSTTPLVKTLLRSTALSAAFFTGIAQVRCFNTLLCIRLWFRNVASNQCDRRAHPRYRQTSFRLAALQRGDARIRDSTAIVTHRFPVHHRNSMQSDAVPGCNCRHRPWHDIWQSRCSPVLHQRWHDKGYGARSQQTRGTVQRST